MAGPEHEVDDEAFSELVEQLEEKGGLETRYNESTGTKEVKLTEAGQEKVWASLRKSDEEVLRSVQAAVEDFDPQAERAQFLERLTWTAQHIRDDVGVNVFRVLDRHPEAAGDLGLGDISQELIEQFEPETTADGES